MKRLVSVILIFVIMFSLSACGKKREPVQEYEPEPMVFTEFSWPICELAGLLPAPVSTSGNLKWANNHGFVLYVESTSASEFAAYSKACQDAGFTVDFRAGAEYLIANNSDGYHIHLKLEEDNIMFIRLDAPKEEEDTPVVDEPVEGSPSQDPNAAGDAQGEEDTPIADEPAENPPVQDPNPAGDGQAAVPDSSSNLRYKNYKDVEAMFLDAGFTNISTEAQYDIIWGWTDEGEIAEISIDGNTAFTKGDIFNADVPVVIKYHMKSDDDPSYRTYEGKVYDRAYYHSEKDGMRARAYWYYLFNESDGTALYICHFTAGSGKTTKLYGTYSGSFDDKVVITLNTSDGTAEHLFYNENGTMYLQRYANEKKAFSAKDVKSSIIDFRNWY